MARRKILKGIASGLISSFNSRNNDVEGYWGLGMLKAHAQHVTISLLDGGVSPATDRFALMAAIYRRQLMAAMERHQLPSSWVVSAVITVAFEPASPELLAPYRCTCAIVDDLGAVHAASAEGRCWAHNARRESQSMRAFRA